MWAPPRTARRPAEGARGHHLQEVVQVRRRPPSVSTAATHLPVSTGVPADGDHRAAACSLASAIAASAVATEGSPQRSGTQEPTPASKRARAARRSGRRRPRRSARRVRAALQLRELLDQRGDARGGAAAEHHACGGGELEGRHRGGGHRVDGGSGGGVARPERRGGARGYRGGEHAGVRDGGRGNADAGGGHARRARGAVCVSAPFYPRDRRPRTCRQKSWRVADALKIAASRIEGATSSRASRCAMAPREAAPAAERISSTGTT